MNTPEKDTFLHTRIGRVSLFIFLLIGLFSFVSLFTEGSNSSPSQKSIYVPDEIDLHIQAQQFVLRGLKAPSTAKFPTLPYEAKNMGDGFYKVKSYVDSQNSFGAMIRSDWTVDMALVEDHWFLDKMIINGKIVYDATSSN